MILHLLNSTLLFFAIICSATLCGLGLLQLCGQGNLPQRILLAPTSAIAASGIAIAIIVILGIPVGTVTPIMWFFWIIFSVHGARHVRSAMIDVNNKYILWVSALATLLVSGGFFWYGISDYLGSPALDGWSYVSFGEYLRLYPKGIEGGLAPLYQYASHLSGTRYVASAMLAVLIPPGFPGIDTQMTVGPLLVLSIFSFALSVAYASQMVNQRGLDTPVFLAILVGVLGWIPHALSANNYDNLLVLPFAPALFALALDRNLNRYGQIFLPAIFMAASIYIYPEMSPLIISAYGVVAAEAFFSTRLEYGVRDERKVLLLTYAGIAILTLVMVSPYLRDVIRFFSQQLSAASQTARRPGEGMMPSLLDGILVWGVMWGLGTKGLAIAIGVLLLLISVFGASAAIAKKYFSLIYFLALIIALFVVMITLKHYDYGAYKIVLIGWWAIAIALAAGAKGIWNSTPSSYRSVQVSARAATIVILLGALGLWVSQQYIRASGYRYKTATETREVRNALLKSPSAVQVSISDTTLNAWMVYQLRDVKALFTEYHGYMDQSHVRPLMNRSKVPGQSEVQLLLTDVNTTTVGETVWQNSLLKLVRGAPDQQPPQVVINAPNGREVLGGVPFFWLGRQDASIILSTPKAKSVSVSFEANVGPSVGASVKDYPKVVIENAGNQLLEFDTQSTKIYTVRITLTPGDNTLVFKNKYAGSVVPNGNGDPRILLVGIALKKVTVDD